MSDEMLRYTVTDDGGGMEPHAAFSYWSDASEWARLFSKGGRRVRVGHTPMGQHHRTIETWCNGEREAT